MSQSQFSSFNTCLNVTSSFLGTMKRNDSLWYSLNARGDIKNYPVMWLEEILLNNFTKQQKKREEENCSYDSLLSEMAILFSRDMVIKTKAPHFDSSNVITKEFSHRNNSPVWCLKLFHGKFNTAVLVCGYTLLSYIKRTLCFYLANWIVASLIPNWTLNTLLSLPLQDLSYNDRHWHSECFLCIKCSRSLVDRPFATKDEMLMCTECYSNEYSAKCHACLKTIMPGEEARWFRLQPT